MQPQQQPQSQEAGKFMRNSPYTATSYVKRSECSNSPIAPGSYNSWDAYKDWNLKHPYIQPSAPAYFPPEIEVLDLTQFSYSTTELDWKSIFIPRIDFRYTRSELIDLFEVKLNMGSVSRIDFAPAKDGSGRMAFIHMSAFNSGSHTRAIRDTMENVGSWELPEEYNLYPLIKLRFIINRRPVPATEFTMETLADVVNRSIYTQEQHIIDIQKRDAELEGSLGRINHWQTTMYSHIQELHDIEIRANAYSKRLYEELESERRKTNEHESRIDRLERLVSIQVRELVLVKSKKEQTSLKLRDMHEKTCRLESELRIMTFGGN